MAIEAATYINQLDSSNPSGADQVADADNHLRLIKATIKATFPNITGPVTSTQTQLSNPTPIGMVSMWWGDEVFCPQGWVIAKGQTVARSDGLGSITVPDLRNRFPFGANADTNRGELGGSSSAGATTTTAGNHNHASVADSQGNHNHAGSTAPVGLSADQLAPHGHSVLVGQVNTQGPAGVVTAGGGGSFGAIGTNEAGSGNPHAHGIALDGAHTHNITTLGAGQHNHDVMVATVPPYLRLWFIIRV